MNIFLGQKLWNSKDEGVEIEYSIWEFLPKIFNNRS